MLLVGRIVNDLLLEVDFSKISDFQISPKYEIEPKYFAEMRNETKLKSSLNKDKYFGSEWKKSNIYHNVCNHKVMKWGALYELNGKQVILSPLVKYFSPFVINFSK